MDTVLIIGAGAAGSVVAQKCAMDRDTFKHITLASRRIESCEKVAKMCKTPIEIAQVDADNVAEVVALINKVKPDLLINMALPYQDLPIMDACVETGTNYMDTANYEPREIAKFEYSWQWAYQDKFVEKGITAILGCGFDPGVSNIWCAYAQEHLFDEIEYIDIVDCNAGDHGKTFATNFNPEINIREVTQDGKYWKDGEWIEIPALSIRCDIDYPEVGPKASYLIYHEEEESLVKNIKGLKQIRFWMTFGEQYIKHLEVFKSIGLIGLEPIKHKGMDIVPDGIPEGPAARAIVPRGRLHRQDLDRRDRPWKEGWQASHQDALQRLRPCRDEQGSLRAGRLLHDRRAAGFRRGHVLQGHLERQGRVQRRAVPVSAIPRRRRQARPADDHCRP